MNKLVLFKNIGNRIYFIRNHRVMIDEDLADVYGVSTKRLNQQVHRNLRRFPPDFMFQLTPREAEFLRLQNATSKRGRGGRRFLPYVFTEHGAIMVSAVLNTSVAITASIQIARAFVKIRELLATHKDLARKLEDLEKKYDTKFKVVFNALRELMEKPSSDAPLIRIKGFVKE